MKKLLTMVCLATLSLAVVGCKDNKTSDPDFDQTSFQPSESVKPSETISVQPSGSVQPSNSTSVQPSGSVQPSSSTSVQPSGSTQPSNSTSEVPTHTHSFDLNLASISLLPSPTTTGTITVPCSGTTCEESHQVVMPVYTDANYTTTLVAEATAKYELKLTSTAIASMIEADTVLDDTALQTALTSMKQDLEPSALGKTFVVVVNGQEVTDYTSKPAGTDKFVFELSLENNDVLKVYENTTLLNVGAETDTTFTASSGDGIYGVWVNATSQVWPSLQREHPYTAYTLKVGETLKDSVSVTPTDGNYAQFTLTLAVGEVVTIYGDETLLKVGAEGSVTSYTATVDGEHTFYVNNKNQVFVSAPILETSLYLVPNSNWSIDNAWFAAYFFVGSTTQWVAMTDENSDGVYEVEIPEGGFTSVIFCRMNPAKTLADEWNGKWNQTADLSIPSDSNVCYTVAEGTWDNGGGTWAPLASE